MREVPEGPFWILLAIVLSSMTLMFRTVSDPWMGMTVIMLPVLGCTLCFSSVRRRLRPSLLRIGLGLVSGAALYGITRLAVLVLEGVWPQWEIAARSVYTWRGGHSTLFTAATLVMIVLAEELFWRGVVSRYFMERFKTLPGIPLAAAVYALAHVATFNPLLLIAALGCGIYWGLLYAATDDLVVPAVSHLLWDVLLLFMFPVIH